MAVKLRPLGDRLVIKPAGREEVSKGGIILPDTATERPQEGTVLAVGKGRIGDDGKLIPMEIKAGNTILFAKYAGSEVKIDGEELIILSERDVLAILS